jgi:hypothetical protein
MSTSVFYHPINPKINFLRIPALPDCILALKGRQKHKKGMENARVR